jgi:D-alanyl-D-alanine carboxypeptidase/D-alanyl-D-alanine-endopeptidase (penicillin-binding protein 4)
MSNLLPLAAVSLISKVARSLAVSLSIAVSVLPVPSQVQENPAKASGDASARNLAALDRLRADIEAVVGQADFARGEWGVKVVSLATEKVLYAHNPEKYFSPASNTKLFTAALALNNLGPDFKIETSLYSARAPDANGTLDGDLIVYGRGDPDFRAGLHSGDYRAALEPLAAALVKSGVKRINGDLIGDQSYFSGPPYGSGWEWDDFQWYYGAEVSALSINDNSLDLWVKPGPHVGAPARIETGPSTSLITLMNRTTTVSPGGKRYIAVYRPIGENVIYVSGSMPAGDSGYVGYVAVHDPALLFVSMLREVLSEHGVTVSGRTRSVDWKYRDVAPLDKDKLKCLGSVLSRPLREIIKDTLKRSQNLYAQLLLLQVGARARNDRMSSDSGNAQRQARSPSPVSTQSGAALQEDESGRTTEQYGLEAMKSFLQSITPPASQLIQEGSGLAYRNEVSPESIVSLLQYMSHHKYGDVFRDSLPVAGLDGTLQNRMKGTAASGNLRAKTGTLAHVVTLSGYVTSVAGEPLAFSILLNGVAPGSGNPGREAVDKVAVLLASFTGHS